MAKQMQNSIRNSIVSTTIKISKDIEVGRLIGRKGRNLKPIAEKTEDIETKSQRKDMEKEEKNVRISDNGNHQHATPRNHKDNDSKEKRKRFNRKMSHTTKTRQSRNKENVKRNA
ncbi:1688_t:CDS:2 [Rhizophagus irregularis]|nr:1688_t:CDS:2 [Rhizophagus irregularis]